MTDIKDIEFRGVSKIEGKSPEIKFAIYDCINDKQVELSIARTNLTAHNLDKLISLNNGICEEPEEICNFLLKSYNSCLKTRQFPIEIYHIQVGWKEIDGKPIYFGQNVISDNETLQSEYSGKLDLKPSGDIKEVIDMLNCEIIATQEWSKLEAETVSSFV